MEDQVKALEQEVFEEINKILIKINGSEHTKNSSDLRSVAEVLNLLVDKTGLSGDASYVMDQYYNSNC